MTGISHVLYCGGHTVLSTGVGLYLEQTVFGAKLSREVHLVKPNFFGQYWALDLGAFCVPDPCSTTKLHPQTLFWYIVPNSLLSQADLELAILLPQPPELLGVAVLHHQAWIHPTIPMTESKRRFFLTPTVTSRDGHESHCGCSGWSPTLYTDPSVPGSW